MITKISIKNFQKHEHLEFEVHPNITAIVGQTGAGKTAVMRAINWVVFNEPSGDAFRKWGSPRTEVTLHTEEGSVTRFRDNTKNGYILRVAGQEQLFSGMGMGVVPEPVRAFLGLEQLNFQHQMDLPFLVCESGGQIARQLNEIVDLGSIDVVLQQLNRIKSQASTKLTAAQGQMGLIVQELSKMDWIERADKDLLALQALEKTMVVNDEAQGTLINILNRLDLMQERAETCASRRQRLQQKHDAFEGLLSMERAAKEAKQAALALATILAKIINVEEKIAKAAAARDTFVETFNRIKPDACPICGGVIGDLK
jgi:exonuclease SbcC